MIFVSVVQRGYTDSLLYGPYGSIDEGRRELTDGKDRGDDGDETRYTFFEVTNEGTNEVGYVLFNDECESRTQDIKEEYFPNHDVSSGVEDRLTNFSMLRNNEVDS